VWFVDAKPVRYPNAGRCVTPHRVDRCDNCGSILIQRTLEQNDKYHALVTDIAKQKQWMGQVRSVPVWKQLISAAYERTQDRHAEILPAIDGHGFDVVYWSSARRTKKDMSGLIEFTTAWAVQNEVKLSEEKEEAEPIGLREQA
jgi:hypothetical protein